MSALKACGGSMPLLTFCWMRCMARENCSRVSLPICLVSARALPRRGGQFNTLHSRLLTCPGFCLKGTGWAAACLCSLSTSSEAQVQGSCCLCFGCAEDRMTGGPSEYSEPLEVRPSLSFETSCSLEPPANSDYLKLSKTFRTASTFRTFRIFIPFKHLEIQKTIYTTRTYETMKTFRTI